MPAEKFVILKPVGNALFSSLELREEKVLGAALFVPRLICTRQLRAVWQAQVTC